MEKTVLISPEGIIAFIHEDNHPAFDCGDAKMERISNVEWNEIEQLWEVHLLKGPLSDMAPAKFKSRAAAIEWEVEYFNENLHELIGIDSN